MSGFEVLRSGMLSLYVDEGRFGYGDIGITQSGPADRYAARQANRLLGNPPRATLIEVNMGGLTLRATTATTIALTGGTAIVKINGRRKPLWHTYTIAPNDTIEIGMITQGLRIYLAATGGFDAPGYLGSTSVSLRDHLGHMIEGGDHLRCSPAKPFPLPRSLPSHLIPTYDSEITLRYVRGTQAEMLGQDLEAQFTDTPWKVTNATDRMGCRLEGTPLAHTYEILSEPIAYGTIQLPRDGQPIVLLNERQTIGGYPKLGAVIPSDAWKLAQARPGTIVHFRKVSVEEARMIEERLQMLW